jgi:hypothetical protein
MNKPSLISELRERELLAQVSDEAALDQAPGFRCRTVYCGFDPTADSLHIGNLVPLLTLRRFQRHGHRPILLLGGATGLIGDPSGRSAERNLNSNDVVSGWVERIRTRSPAWWISAGAGSGQRALIVNNLDWIASSALSRSARRGQTLLRESDDSARVGAPRLDRQGEGISYTEFSYMLLQALDYAELARRYDCTVQIGGSDQWGNIVPAWIWCGASSAVNLRRDHAADHQIRRQQVRQDRCGNRMAGRRQDFALQLLSVLDQHCGRGCRALPQDLHVPGSRRHRGVGGDSRSAPEDGPPSGVWPGK